MLAVVSADYAGPAFVGLVFPVCVSVAAGLSDRTPTLEQNNKFPSFGDSISPSLDYRRCLLLVVEVAML